MLLRGWAVTEAPHSYENFCDAYGNALCLIVIGVSLNDNGSLIIWFKGDKQR